MEKMLLFSLKNVKFLSQVAIPGFAVWLPIRQMVVIIFQFGNFVRNCPEEASDIRDLGVSAG
ncbi:hypothetical protein [Motiliproteus sp. MSK22-1]|uniref:hypothetical protein n=1 Tax=Motiliproteus sp. MSK22-1 TaxID=1897630 RepID=UPI00117D03EE|nr:hypothetical protein [Motiliproteus sp. MSK22-1]